MDHAIRAALIGTGVRVELADTLETTWVELDCDMVRPCRAAENGWTGGIRAEAR